MVTNPCTISAVCVTGGLITGDCVLAVEMGATTVGSTAVEVVAAGRDCKQHDNLQIQNSSTLRPIWIICLIGVLRFTHFLDVSITYPADPYASILKYNF